MPLTKTHIPQTWVQLRTSAMLCIGASEVTKKHHRLSWSLHIGMWPYTLMTYIIQYIRAVVIKHANRMALILQDAPFASLADYKVFNLKWMKTQDEGSRFSSRRRLGSETLMRSIYCTSGGEVRTSGPSTSICNWEKNADGRGPSIDSGNPMIWIFGRLLQASRSGTLCFSRSLTFCNAQ